MIRQHLFSVLLPTALVILVLLAFRLALQACDTIPSLFGYLAGACPTEAVVAWENDVSGALARRDAMQAHINHLQRRLALRECPIVLPLPAGRIEASKAIDTEAWENRDVSLLDGCWELDSDLSFLNRVTGEIRAAQTWKMCFDGAGNGTQNLSLDGGGVCTSDQVSAAFDAAGNLVVQDNSDIQCSDSTYIYERIITCQLADDGTASCVSRQPETGSRSSLSLRR